MSSEPEVGFVVAPVATLWSDPAAVRPVDAPALACRADVGAWVAGMDPDERVGDIVLSQLLFGERVLVERDRSDTWTRVVAVEQPAAGLDPRGYPGWLPAVQLRLGALPAVSLVVDALATDLRDAPGGRVVLAGVPLGTRLPSAGTPSGGWQPVDTPYGPLWADAAAVVPLPATGTATDALAMARRLLDVPYVWGGLSGHGIDCSGLVHLAWRRLGVRLPRDAHDQAAATVPVPPGQERPGDLYFFAHPGQRVHHVAFATGEGRMLHACYRQRRVVEEPMPADRATTLVATHRVALSDPR